MIGKFVVYILVGLLTNAVLVAWLTWFVHSKCKNDESGKIYNDLMHEYTRLVICARNRIFVRKKNKRSDGSDSNGPTVEQDTREFDDYLTNRMGVLDWIFAMLMFIVIWPYEVILTKGYTIPRIIAYAKKYDET